MHTNAAVGEAIHAINQPLFPHARTPDSGVLWLVPSANVVEIGVCRFSTNQERRWKWLNVGNLNFRCWVQDLFQMKRVHVWLHFDQFNSFLFYSINYGNYWYNFGFISLSRYCIQKNTAKFDYLYVYNSVICNIAINWHFHRKIFSQTCVQTSFFNR